jgi:hypothetical protein
MSGPCLDGAGRTAKMGCGLNDSASRAASLAAAGRSLIGLRTICARGTALVLAFTRTSLSPTDDFGRGAINEPASASLIDPPEALRGDVESDAE